MKPSIRIAGIDIGATSLKFGILDTENGFIHQEIIVTAGADAEKMVEIIARMVAKHPVSMIGLGSAGAVNVEAGTVSASNMNWRRVPLREMVEKRTGLPVWVDNDAQAALTAEWYDGACQGAQTAIYLTLGTGIGGALILSGKPWRGHNNTAAELGHIITHPDGLPCNCSQQGCYEMYASARALSRIAGGASVQSVAQGVRRQDPLMCAAFDAYIHELSIGLTTLMAIFTPETIVLGGGISEAGDILLPAIQKKMQANFTRRVVDFEKIIALAKHRNSAGMIGAAVLAQLHLSKA